MTTAHSTDSLELTTELLKNIENSATLQEFDVLNDKVDNSYTEKLIDKKQYKTLINALASRFIQFPPDEVERNHIEALLSEEQ